MAAPLTENELESKGKSKSLTQDKSDSKFKEILFFTGIASVSMIGGFSAALTRTKKKDPDYFMKGFTAGQDAISGSALGTRALMIGTAISVSSVGLLFFAAYKLSGAQSIRDFGEKLRNKSPQLPKKESTGRNEFGSVKELVDYILAGGKG